MFLCYVVKIYLPIIDNDIACLNILHYTAYKCIEAISQLKLFEIINMFNYTLYYLSVECYIDITLIITNNIWMLLCLVSWVCWDFFIYTYNYIYMPNSMQIMTCVLYWVVSSYHVRYNISIVKWYTCLFPTIVVICHLGFWDSQTKTIHKH